MARTDSLEHFLTDVADSIREKTQETGTIKADEFDVYINNIETGSKVQLQTTSVVPTTSLQVIQPSDGYDGFSTIYVNAVDSSIDANIQPYNIKKGVSILGTEGSLLVEEPTGTIEITSNGSYNVKNYASAKVTVGDNPITKGVIVNTCNSNGYPTDVSIVGITTIPTSFMTGGTLLKYVKTIHTNDTTTVGNYAFQDLANLVTVEMSNVTNILLRSFGGCSKLNIPKLPDGLIQIGQDGFRQCSALALSELPSSVKEIGSEAFYYCKTLQLTELPEGLEKINSGAFNGCSGIKITTLPKSLTLLDKNAFKGCSAITTMTIPSNITNIPDACFQSCKALKELYFEGDTNINGYYPFSWCVFEKIVFRNATKVPTIDATAFSNVDNLKTGGTCVIYVPDTLLDEWKVAENWTTYANFIKPLSELPE